MIYCVEDDASIRDLMIYALNSAGFEAEGISNGKEFNSALEIGIPDLIILDIMLPEEDGISILKRLKRNPKTAQIPVIIASARGLEYDKVAGLDSGADDYLVKPFGMAEMISRVKAVLRRSYKEQDSGILNCSDLTLDEQAHRVLVCGEPIKLTLKEYELLRLLIKNKGAVASREQLLSAVCGDDYIGETRTLDVHMGTLRSKLGAFGKLIKTIRGVGYKIEENYDE